MAIRKEKYNPTAVEAGKAYLQAKKIYYTI